MLRFPEKSFQKTLRKRGDWSHQALRFSLQTKNIGELAFRNVTNAAPSLEYMRLKIFNLPNNNLKIII